MEPLEGMKLQVKCRVSTCENRNIKNRPFCEIHWDRVPEVLKDRMLYYFRPGQEYGIIRPFPEFIRAARKAIRTILKEDEDALLQSNKKIDTQE